MNSNKERGSVRAHITVAMTLQLTPEPVRQHHTRRGKRVRNSKFPTFNSNSPERVRLVSGRSSSCLSHGESGVGAEAMQALLACPWPCLVYDSEQFQQRSSTEIITLGPPMPANAGPLILCWDV